MKFIHIGQIDQLPHVLTEIDQVYVLMEAYQPESVVVEEVEEEDRDVQDQKRYAVMGPHQV